MKEILDTILDPGSEPADFGAVPVPACYRAVTLHRDEEHMFDGLERSESTRLNSSHTIQSRMPSSA